MGGDDEQERDLGTCPYYRKITGLPGAEARGPNGPGTCTFTCYDEPECVTCEPVGGWPSVVALTELARIIAAHETTIDQCFELIDKLLSALEDHERKHDVIWVTLRDVLGDDVLETIYRRYRTQLNQPS